VKYVIVPYVQKDFIVKITRGIDVCVASLYLEWVQDQSQEQMLRLKEYEIIMWNMSFI